MTVMIARPPVSGVIATSDPDTLTEATDGADEAAACVSVSPSGSRNAAATSTVTASVLRSSVRSARIPAATGG